MIRWLEGDGDGYVRYGREVVVAGEGVEERLYFN